MKGDMWWYTDIQSRFLPLHSIECIAHRLSGSAESASAEIGRPASSWEMMGTRYARVLPLPVSAATTTSWPAASTFTDRSCTCNVNQGHSLSPGFGYECDSCTNWILLLEFWCISVYLYSLGKSRACDRRDVGCLKLAFTAKCDSASVYS